MQPAADSGHAASHTNAAGIARRSLNPHKSRRTLQALGDSAIPDEPSHAEDWQTAIEGLRLAREASNQASTAVQLIGEPSNFSFKLFAL